MVLTTDKLIHVLEQHGIKTSYQRLQVLEYLSNDNTHPTADTIFQNIHKDSPVISKATVYNTLKLFAEKGIITTMIADKFETRYDFVTEDHGHFICNSCGKIFNFNYDYNKKYSDLKGFQIEKEEIVLKGICKDCQNKK